MHRLLKRLLNLFLVALLLTAIWAGWYVSHRGFGQKWRKKVSEEFAKRGVTLTLRRLTLDPLRGLVAQDVKIWRDDSMQKLAARIDQVNLDISYTKVLQKSPFLNALELRNAQLRLPVDPARPNGRALQFTNLQARLYFPPGKVEVRRLEGDLAAMHLQLSGTLLNPGLYRPVKSPGGTTNGLGRSQGNLLSKLYGELAKIQVSGESPRLQVHFSGDLAQPDSLRMDEATLTAGNLRWREINARRIDLKAAFHDGRLTFQQIGWQDDTGPTQISGWWQTDGDFSLQLHSGMDWLAAVRSFRPKNDWPPLILNDPVTVDMEISRALKKQPSLKILGHVQTGELHLSGVALDSASAGFSSDGERWMVRDLEVKQPGGSLKADLLGQGQNFEAKLRSSLAPSEWLSLMGDPAQSLLHQLNFLSPPYAELQITGPGPNPVDWKIGGTLFLGRTSFRGYVLNSARSDLAIQGGTAVFTNVQVVRDEGVGTGSFTWDGMARQVRLSKIHSTLDPVAVCTWIMPNLGKAVAPYRFRQSPQIEVDGQVQVASPTGTALTIEVHAPAGMNYTFLKKDLPIDELSGRLFFHDRRLELQELSGELFGGKIKGGADISLLPHEHDYQARIELKDVDFSKSTGLYFDYSGSQGKVSGAYEFGGSGPEGRTMSGKGRIAVEEGNVFAIPVFGPFSRTLDQVLPGFGYQQARKARGTFTISEGVLKTDDFEIQGKGVSMFGSGEIGFLDDKMDFNMRVNATGLPGTLLNPVSKFFEFNTKGPLQSPVWHPRHFPLANPSPAAALPLPNP